jgi:hypothetical protein
MFRYAQTEKLRLFLGSCLVLSYTRHWLGERSPLFFGVGMRIDLVARCSHGTGGWPSGRYSLGAIAGSTHTAALLSDHLDLSDRPTLHPLLGLAFAPPPPPFSSGGAGWQSAGKSTCGVTARPAKLSSPVGGRVYLPEMACRFAKPRRSSAEQKGIRSSPCNE